MSMSALEATEVPMSPTVPITTSGVPSLGAVTKENSSLHYTANKLVVKTSVDRVNEGGYKYR
jgi:hypothetical protein